LLEYFDEQGEFHHEEWNAEEGFIKRSTRFDPRNTTNPTAYTSLIVDARKPSMTSATYAPASSDAPTG
jgi:predicted SAM-dependent methyltransferase